MRLPMLAILLCCAATPAIAQPRSVFVEDLTWPEVRAAIASGRSNAIVYVGGTEQNGPHMAIGKHTFIAHAVAGRIADSLGSALVLPTLPYSIAGDAEKHTGHMRFPGSVTLSAETFTAVVRDVTVSALAAGFRNVFVMGDHGGGQEQLKTVAASLDSAWAPKGAHVFYVPDLYFRAMRMDSTYLVSHGIPVGSHAGVDDTSQIMYLDVAHRWIRADQLGASAGKPQSETGVSGDPTKSSVELGKRFIDNKVAAAVSQIRQQLGEGR
jgi:creatinine amidohydrolase